MIEIERDKDRCIFRVTTSYRGDHFPRKRLESMALSYILPRWRSTTAQATYAYTMSITMSTVHPGSLKNEVDTIGFSKFSTVI